MTSKTLSSIDPAIENRRIVLTCIFQAAGSKAEWSISYNYRFHIVTRFKHGAILYNEAEVSSLSVTSPNGRPMLPFDWLIRSCLVLASCHRIVFVPVFCGWEVIYQTRETVFHRDIQTPRRELKTRRAAEYFWRSLRCLDNRWNTVSSVWYIFSIETKN